MARLLNIRLRRGTSAAWASANPVLDDGEIAFDKTTRDLVVGDGSTAFASLPKAGSGTYAPLAVTQYDVFTDAADAASIAARQPLVGSPWLNTGGQGVALASGYAASTGTGYMYVAGNPDVLSCDVAFSGSTTARMMTVAWSSSATFDLLNLVHLNFGPSDFSLTVRQDGGSFDVIKTESWGRIFPVDGTVLRFTFAIDGDRLVAYAPSGVIVASVRDPRIAALRGNWVFWEPNKSGSDSAKLQAVSSYALTARNALGSLKPGQGAAPGVYPKYTSGGDGARWQVSVGYESTQRMPGVVFGAAKVYTRLAGAHSAGASSVITEEPIPKNSTIVIESGTNGESVTAGNVTATGTGPYTLGLTGTLANAHADGSAVVATTPAVASTFMYLNTENGFFYLPNTSTLAAPQGIYLSSDFDTRLTRSSANVVQVGGSSTGCVRTGQAVTGSRPSAATVGRGSMFYDTTLSKPIWSDGTNWKDATGTTV